MKKYIYDQYKKYKQSSFDGLLESLALVTSFLVLMSLLVFLPLGTYVNLKIAGDSAEVLITANMPKRCSVTLFVREECFKSRHSYKICSDDDFLDYVEFCVKKEGKN